MLFALESFISFVGIPSSSPTSKQVDLKQLKTEQPFPEAELSIAGESAVVADWSQVSLADFSPLEGHNTRVENELTLGDLALAIDIESLTFDSILSIS